MNSLKVKALGGSLIVLVVMGALFFLLAWTFAYWQAWTLLVVFVLVYVVIVGYLLKNDPRLLERRLSAGPTAEQKTSQKIIMSIASLGFVALLVLPPLDHRFGWSSVPSYISIIGDVLVVLGWLIIFFVFRENSYTSATIEVASDQKVVSTGPYSIVRHPMYSGSLLYMLGIPIALGSWWSVMILFLLLPVSLWRIFDEEQLLSRDLAGYSEYIQKVRYRLIPFVW